MSFLFIKNKKGHTIAKLLYNRNKIYYALKNPRKALKYYFSKKATKNFSGYNSENALQILNSIRQCNKISKYYTYLEFCKNILSDNIVDEPLRNRFFNNPEQITESEMQSAILNKTDLKGQDGWAWRRRALTMIGVSRLDPLQFCIEDTIKNNIQGDLIETGVWRGGACIFMRLMLKKYGVKDKIVYVADSFEGLPKPDTEKYPKDAGDVHHIMDYLKISKEQVQNNFKSFGVLDNQVQFLKGWFKDTLKHPPFEKLSILRLDGDMYESTWDVLENLYYKLSVGGYIIIDDYALSACHAAVDEFRAQNNIEEIIEYTDGGNVFWKKQRTL